MQTRVQKWGNSLAVRIPKSFANHSHLSQDSLVQMSTENGVITLVPIAKPALTLDDLLDQITDNTVHDAIDFGAAIGKRGFIKMPAIPERGDLVRIDFNRQSGHEQARRRSAIVLSPAKYNRRSA